MRVICWNRQRIKNISEESGTVFLMTLRTARFILVLTFTLLVMPGPAPTGQTGNGPPQSVVWTSLTNCAITGNSLQKVAGRGDSADAGARSQQNVTAGDAYLEFTAGELNKILFCGLTHATTGTSFVDIDFSIKLTEFGVAEARENNVYVSETTYRVGDVFRIAVQSGAVRFYKNGGSFYMSSKTPAYPLFADASFLTIGGRIDNAVIGALSVSSTADWPMYQHDSAHGGYSSASRLDSSNVSSLTEAWNFKMGGWVTGTPIVADGRVYAGSWDGKMYALRESDGSLLWSFTADLSSDECGYSYGIDGTAAVSSGKLYFGSAGCVLYALDASSGNLIWRTQLDDWREGFHLWSSPLLAGGKIYVGLGSHCDHPCDRGRVVCVDATTAQVLWTFDTVPDGIPGADV